ncbi:MAG: hypothetical protein R3F54_22780 [Alphaproteobacteria bacterium]
MPRSDEPGAGSRRWLALGLAGMVYAVGVMGLWSMVETFQETGTKELTPAGGHEVLPPVDDTVDVRDARLHGLANPAAEAKVPL